MRSFPATGRVALRTWILAFSISAISSVLCVAYVDRPLATFFDGHFRQTVGWVLLHRSLEPLRVVAISALVFLFWAGYRMASGYGLQEWAQKALVCSCAVVWGLAAE